MPDVHQGYGFPIGGVAATDFRDGVISPGGIGYDINCGVRLLSSNISIEQAKPELETLANMLYQEVPSGTGRGGTITVSRKEFFHICEKGSRWALERGFATSEDIDMTENGGCLSEADMQFVSERAVDRGLHQVGSLGSGNLIF